MNEQITPLNELISECKQIISIQKHILKRYTKGKAVSTRDEIRGLPTKDLLNSYLVKAIQLNETSLLLLENRMTSAVIIIQRTNFELLLFIYSVLTGATFGKQLIILLKEKFMNELVYYETIRSRVEPDIDLLRLPKVNTKELIEHLYDKSKPSYKFTLYRFSELSRRAHPSARTTYDREIDRASLGLINQLLCNLLFNTFVIYEINYDDLDGSDIGKLEDLWLYIIMEIYLKKLENKAPLFFYYPDSKDVSGKLKINYPLLFKYPIFRHDVCICCGRVPSDCICNTKASSP